MLRWMLPHYHNFLCLVVNTCPAKQTSENETCLELYYITFYNIRLLNISSLNLTDDQGKIFEKIIKI